MREHIVKADKLKKVYSSASQKIIALKEIDIEIKKGEFVTIMGPTGNLDTKNAQELFTLFRNLNKEKGLTIVVATHNVRLGYSADRVIHLNDGKMEKDERLVK